ncbi:hypothetical protein BDV93DRAFT_525832 [Ceratobasidium sp. AG-I]|nr:hypothetical protein BDV93DRAFT_525832 [Ceratobasidium sp. AG-I]
MAKSRKARGKEPARTPGHNNDNNINKLTRDAQTHHIKNRGRKKLVPNDQLKDDEFSSDEESNSQGEIGSDDNADVTTGGYYALEAEYEDEDVSDPELQLDNEEALIHELQEQLRARQAAFQQHKKTTTSAAQRPGSSVNNPTSTRAPTASSGRARANTPVHTSTSAAAPVRSTTLTSTRATAPAWAQAAAPVPAPAPVPVPTPAPAPTPTATPIDYLSARPKEPEPLVWPGGIGIAQIPLPQRKVDYSMEKIRQGLGALGDRPGWNRALATVRNGIVRCNLDVKKEWTRQCPTKVGLLLPILNTLIPGFSNFQDNWAALFMIQSAFNNARATQLKLEREEANQQAATNQPASQVNIDDPALQRFHTPRQLASEPEHPPRPAPGQHYVTQAASPRHTSSSRRQRTAVPPRVSAEDLALAQPSLPPARAPPPAAPPTPAASIPPAGPTPLEKPKVRPRPKMRPPPVAYDDPVCASTNASVPGVPLANLPAQAPGLTKAKGKRKVASLSSPLQPLGPTGWPEPPVTPRPSPLRQTSPIMEVGMHSPQHSSSGARSSQRPPSETGAPPTGRVLVPDTQSLALVDNSTVEKPVPIRSRPLAETAATPAINPPAGTPGPLASSVTKRRSGLRSGQAAADAVAAVEQTANARQKQQSKKRRGSPLKKPQPKKTNRKRGAAPSSSPPSEPLEPEPEDRSENDDGFHSPDEE